MPDPAPPGGLALALLRASDWFNDALVAHLGAQGWPELNRTQSLTFANLGPQGARPSDLARRVGISRQSMQKLLAELAGHGLIAVSADPHDRRATVVSLTPQGEQLGRAAAATLAQLESELTERIGPGTVAGLRAALAADWGPAPWTDRDL